MAVVVPPRKPDREMRKVIEHAKEAIKAELLSLAKKMDKDAGVADKSYETFVNVIFDDKTNDPT